MDRNCNKCLVVLGCPCISSKVHFPILFLISQVNSIWCKWNTTDLQHFSNLLSCSWVWVPQVHTPTHTHKAPTPTRHPHPPPTWVAHTHDIPYAQLWHYWLHLDLWHLCLVLHSNLPPPSYPWCFHCPVLHQPVAYVLMVLLTGTDWVWADHNGKSQNSVG